MQGRNDKARLAAEIKDKKYIDNYIEKWLNLEAPDKPYIECEICGYISNASIHQHLLAPEELVPNSGDNRILHLCSNCNYELRTLIDRHLTGVVPGMIQQVCEEAFNRLKDMKKQYRDAHKNLERIEV
ncbi:hypothetical protein [Candidatus Methanoperedens nitratireducens]|uniref:HNH domain-containing protein n=1 Tax=Candidatus Methanoperedens nitratireducens TaxID=1392998 RepID=A0A284VSA1_9EURY|nr:hypothetical protein [Candidatus Methanoperedens nitroreducens]SNQ62164.1 hypothetical protein MNV_60045 [Candidatus Methanoperedens nitroreducens]